MSNQYYETFYGLIFLIFWVIVPLGIGIGLFIFFARMSNAYMHHKKSLDDMKWQVKWGYTWTGKPYIKDQGWGTSYSKLSKEEYFTKLHEERIKEGIVAGVDGCKAGWLCIKKNVDTGVVSSEVFSNAQSLLQQKPEHLVIAVDIPIGLMESGPRQCDIEARKLIGERRSSVFPAPIRPALHASSRKQASEIQQGIEGKGVTKQSFALYRKIIEFDKMLSEDTNLQKIVKEIHPEVCFWACNNNKPMPHYKKSEEGRAERHDLICKYVGEKAIKEIRSKYLVKEVAHDDIYDAFIALWTADRIYKGNAGLIPNPSPCDEKGIHMEMWY